MLHKNLLALNYDYVALPQAEVGVCVQDKIREYGGIQSLVNLLAAGPEAECTHRALLALRILTDKETDRLAILKAGGIAHLVSLLAAGPDSEVTEYAAAALGNLAAGSQQIKDAIRQVCQTLGIALCSCLFTSKHTASLYIDCSPMFCLLFCTLCTQPISV